MEMLGFEKCLGRKASFWARSLSKGLILSKVSVERFHSKQGVGGNVFFSYVFPESLALSRSSWPVRASVFLF